MTAVLVRRAQAMLAVASLAAVGLLLAACGNRGSGAPGHGDHLAALPSLAADSVTASGISAGGYMAVQFHVAHSALVHGVGVIAAGPYFCAQNSLAQALGRCMKGDDPIDVDELVGLTSELALAGRVDPIANLADDRIWILRGGADPVVAKPVVDALQAYYSLLVEPRDIARVDLPNAGHTFPSAGSGLQRCETTDTPFVGGCGYDAAAVLLQHLYGPFAGKAKTAAGELIHFSQTPYARATGADGLAARGWLYVPAACGSAASGAAGRCRLHVAFHGCKQGASYVKDAFVRQTGYLEAADAGRIVVLFPQVEPSFSPLNPNGCWDWWGYDGDDYVTQAAPQIAAITAMVQDLLGESSAAAPQ